MHTRLVRLCIDGLVGDPSTTCCLLVYLLAPIRNILVSDKGRKGLKLLTLQSSHRNRLTHPLTTTHCMSPSNSWLHFPIASVE